MTKEAAFVEMIPGGGVTSPSGFRAGAVACGLKRDGQLDLTLLASERPCAAAGVFTTNIVAAAPVLLDREVLAVRNNHIRGVVANAGNANACTGAPGLWAARQMQGNAAFALGCAPEEVLVLSTGVIGAQLPMPTVNAGIDGAARRLSPERGRDAARAIMTTDTVVKEIAVRVELPEGTVTIGGMAKGSGMIHPRLATMLAVLTTDAVIEPDALATLLQDAVARSFNCISVDGDTSTNDTVLLLANGAAAVTLGEAVARTRFATALDVVCQELAQMIVRDGEGATKFVTLHISGAASAVDAHRVADAIATSPLVKTALAGNDPNWGRILAAAGRSGVRFIQSDVALWIGSTPDVRLQLVAAGTPTGYQEVDAAAVFAQPEIYIHLDLGAGTDAATVWTCDLTHDYVTINADYRT